MSKEQQRLIDTARTLLRGGGALQSTGPCQPIAPDALKKALEDQLRVETAGNGNRAVPQKVVHAATAVRIVSEAQNVFGREGSDVSRRLSDSERASLEAIIEVVGRPALFYADGRVEMPASGLGENDRWQVLVAIARSEINAASAAIGQLALTLAAGTPEVLGTAWRLGADLVVTNRHLARRLVSNPDEHVSGWAWDASKVAIVDFGKRHDGAAQRVHQVEALAYCPAEPDLDIAVLRLKGNSELPEPLDLNFTTEAIGRNLPSRKAETRFEGAEIYVVGHPYADTTSSAIHRVFGAADGRKRCSPGVVTALPANQVTFEHDCSTLGGNSGSCILSVRDHSVVGLHFGGADVDPDTFRGRANVAIAFARLGSHHAASILARGAI